MMDDETLAAIDLAVEGDEQLLREALEALNKLMAGFSHGGVNTACQCAACVPSRVLVTKLEERLLRE